MASTLSMPSAAVEAARTFGASDLLLAHGMAEDDLEQRLILLNKGIFSYGVAQAVLSGQRLRLFHELKPFSDMVNCGEFGIAAFTIYKAFSKVEDAQVLRYRPFANGSYHFGIVRGDGKDDFVIVDPLLSLHGKIRLNNDGFVFYPFSWLDSHSIDEASISTVPLLAGGEKKDSPLRVISDLTFLGEDTLLRHVNFINSPLGFLAYFADGQRLEETVSDGSAMSYCAEIGEDGLTVRASGHTDKLALHTYTVERLFPFESISVVKERELLHSGINWVRPDKPLYSRANGREEIHVWPDPVRQTLTLDLLIGAAGKSGPLFAPEDTESYLRGLEQMLEGWRSGAPDFDEGLRALSDKGLNYWKATNGRELVKELESFVSLQRNDLDAERQENLNSILNRLHFGRYVKGLAHEWPEQEVLRRFRSWADNDANLFGSSIKAYFESPVVAALLQQYQETVKIVVQNRHVFEQHTTA